MLQDQRGRPEHKNIGALQARAHHDPSLSHFLGDNAAVLAPSSGEDRHRHAIERSFRSKSLDFHTGSGRASGFRKTQRPSGRL